MFGMISLQGIETKSARFVSFFNASQSSNMSSLVKLSNIVKPPLLGQFKSRHLFLPITQFIQNRIHFYKYLAIAKSLGD